MIQTHTAWHGTIRYHVDHVIVCIIIRTLYILNCTFSVTSTTTTEQKEKKIVERKKKY